MTECTRSQVSKGGIAYASDVHRFIVAPSNPPDLNWREFLEDREEHEEEEVANAGPSENGSQPTRHIPEPRRKKRKNT